MAFQVEKQSNIAVNKARHLIFFEGTEICYNYKTGQWTAVPAYVGLGFYSLNSKIASIGLVRYSSGSVDLQGQSTGFVAQTAVLTTGATDLNKGGRSVVTGVRPLVEGGTITVRAGKQDFVGGTVTWSASTSINSRTKTANFRSEGRYARTEVTITGGFTSIFGADVEFTPQGST